MPWWMHPMTCTEGCRTFLWEGTGVPDYDNEGSCSCDCDHYEWADDSVLGHPSCVPMKAHLVFGWIGFVFSVSALCHAVYHLRRQLRFHERHQSASTSPVERCRQELHIAAIVVSTLHICFCGMVLGDRLLHSVAVLSIAQIPISIGCAVLVTRMWIYTKDPILMRKSPEVLRISRWLETLAGRRMAFGFVSIPPVCALVLDIMNYPETAMEVVAAGIILLCGACLPAMFWVCGRSLIRAIDDSILQQQQQQQQQQDVSAANGKGHEGQQSKQRGLLRARQKVQTIVMVAFFVCGTVTGLLLFAVCSKYGTAVPLLLYASPMALVPPLWNIFHIQLHAGRTKLSSDGNNLTSMLFNMFSLSGISVWRSRIVQPGVISRVVPDEVSP